MSIGRTREEQELTQLLARTLVQKEVMEPMEKIGWSHASPPPPDYSGQPAPAEGAPTQGATPGAQPNGGQPAVKPNANPQSATQVKADTPQNVPDIVATLESLRDAQTGLIMGKYKTVDEALKGAGHLANMAKQAFQERDAAREQLTALRTGSVSERPQPGMTPHVPAPAAEPSTLVASRAALDKAKADLDQVLSSVDEDGGVFTREALTKVSELNRQIAEHAADVRVQENRFREESEKAVETNRWKAVDDFMAANHPEALTLSAEIGVHIASDPVLQDAIGALVAQGKEVQASVLAWNSYQRAVGNGTATAQIEQAQHKEDELQVREQVRKELRDQALKDAGVIAGSGGGQGIHENADAGGPSKGELDAAIGRMRLEGDGLGMPGATAFRHMLIGRHLDPSIFGPR